MKRSTQIIYPLLIAAAIIAGIYIGKYYDRMFTTPVIYSGHNKIEGLLNMIKRQYVDTVSIDSLIEIAIPKIIGELDPHSTYISAADLQMVNDDLEGTFSGIGIEFSILDDTITVVGVISGGPSEKVGIIPGDRIIAVNDTAFTGSGISNEKVLKRLRGQKGSEVRLTLKRVSSAEPIDMVVTRGDIPVNSIDAAFRTNDGIGYIKVSKFGRNTYTEFLNSLAKLRREGSDKFIIDLRGNTGGYMESAINMVNEFLPKGFLIVYTYGNASPMNRAYSNGTGIFKESPVVVLLDEWSASASEIFAGAIQDNDRGLIVGRRSFGKGLVQQQIPFSDGSAVRLTIARYYTPSGRSIQKEYKMGDSKEYDMDIINRYEHGEFYSRDSIHLNDTLEYRTLLGRTVYGGGGIMPDVFVPRDTLGNTPYLTSVVNQGLLYQFAFKYADDNRAKLKQYTAAKDLLGYLQRQPLLDRFVTYAAGKGVKPRPVYIGISRKIIENTLYAYIARNIIGDEAFYPIVLMDDNTFVKAVELLNDDETYIKMLLSGKE